jgi:hypothetical protein
VPVLGDAIVVLAADRRWRRLLLALIDRLTEVLERAT